MKTFNKNLLLIIVCFCFSQIALAQPCFSDQVVTAAFATGGTSPYREDVLWLTWGTGYNERDTNPFGKHGVELNKGDKSRASIHLGGNSYLCIEVEITSISNGTINSYAPGNYNGDSMDKLYNIGGTGSNNKLVSGIINRNQGSTATITFRAKATINGEPIRLTGLAIADAESLDANGEYINATAYGNWNIVDVRKNSRAGNYRISKRAVGSNQQRIEFSRGNDKNTGAVAFLEFNQYAFNKENGLAVEFTAELKGSGLTALAIGLLTPNPDLGDAPASYGSPLHLVQNLKVNSDGINVADTGYTDINTSDYNPGSLTRVDGKYLGSAPPDGDSQTMFSKDAKGDDTSGSGSRNEEDAWPIAYKSFSYKVNYDPGNKIDTKIPFKNGVVGDRISGWIDFNLNGKFDENERQTKQISKTDISNGYVNLVWIVPGTRIVKSTFVRLRYFDAKEDYLSPTASVNLGEVEDHRMIILVPKSTNVMLQNKTK